MHSHLDIKVNGKSLVLPDDFSLAVEESNPMFNDVSFFSYPVQIPTKGNLAILKNIAQRDSNMRAIELDHADALIYADGMPLNNGQVITQEDTEIKDKFEFNIDAQRQSFSDLINNLNCRDVKVKDRIVIGEKIGRIEFHYNIQAQDKLVKTYFDGYQPSPSSGTHNHSIDSGTSGNDDSTLNFSAEGDSIVESPQPLGFSFYGRTQGFPAAEKDTNGNLIVTEGFINVSQPYPYPYCNGRVAYAHPAVKTNTDGTQETEGTVEGNDRGHDPRDFGKYWCLGADRQQSGICFYVLYFLDCLFEQLGVTFDKSDLLEVEDFKRLCFFTTQCHFDEEDVGKELYNNQIAEWLNSRSCGGTLTVNLVTGNADYNTKPSGDRSQDEYNGSALKPSYPIELGSSISINEMYSSFKTSRWKNEYYRIINASITNVKSSVYDMVANSKNFPNASVSSVIESLENSFGIRFIYSADDRLVKAVFLRDIYRRSALCRFNGKVISMTPMTEKITGVRMLYSAESDSEEQRNNVRYKVRDYDTEYDYIDYPEGKTVFNLQYQEVTKHVLSTNQNVYVDLTTGNRYRVKIYGDAEDTLSLKPTLFQVGQWKGVEIGDCSADNESYVREFKSDFTPLDLNIINAKEYNGNQDGTVDPILAPLLDVEMEHEYLKKEIQSVVEEIPTKDMYLQTSNSGTTARPGSIMPGGYIIRTRSNKAFPNDIQLVLSQGLTLSENYDPTQTDSGNSPLQDIDWGMTIAVMRGGGSDSQIVYYDENYDFFGNYRWKDIAGTYALTSDTMDTKGAVFDYNGSESGIGAGERFSLAIRSWAQFVYYIDDNGKVHINKDIEQAGKKVENDPNHTWLIPCDDDERDQQGNIINKIRSRGLFDTFMREHVYFLLNRKKYCAKAFCTIAQLLEIRNHWQDRYDINGKIGYIDKLGYSISRKNGLGEVTIYFYSI